MLVQVTGDDIINGMPGRSCECAVARAIRRCIDGSVEVEVDDNISIGCSRLGMPKEAEEFIAEYDALPTGPGGKPDLEAATSCPLPIAFELPGEPGDYSYPDGDDDGSWDDD
jgi:hypothetical protein